MAHVYDTLADAPTLYNNVWSHADNFPLFNTAWNRYLNVYVHWTENGDTGDSDQLLALYAEPNTGEFGEVFWMWREQSIPTGIDFRMGSHDHTANHRVAVVSDSSLPMNNVGTQKVIVSVDSSDIHDPANFQCWVDGASQTPATRSRTTTSGQAGYPYAFYGLRTQWDSSTRLHIRSGSTNNNVYPHGRTSLASAIWTSPYPMTQAWVDLLDAGGICPWHLPSVHMIWATDYNEWPPKNLVTGKGGLPFPGNTPDNIPAIVQQQVWARNPTIQVPIISTILNTSAGHTGHILPDAILEQTNLFGTINDINDIDIDDGNWLTVTEPALIDTFTDTNSTQIDNHTPELVFSVDGWIKNGVTSYPQIQSNKLVFNSTGQNETAELDLGLLGTTAFSKPYIISGEATWLSPGGGVVTFEIGEKPFWTGYYINNTGWLFELDDDVSAIELSTRISQVENVVSTYSGYDFTANNGVHSFEVKVYPTGLVEGRAWPSNGTRPDAAMVSYDYSVHSEIYTMTSREFTIATWINQNFEVNNLNIEDSFIPESNTNTANTLGGTAALFPIAGSWVNASNALVDNEADASWTGALNTPFTTTFLRLTNFGFSLPADASVAGVEISMRKLGSQMKSITARLTGFSGTEFGTQIEFIDEPTDPNVATIGGIGYDWGVNLTKAFVESIGIDIQGVSNDSVSGTAAIQIEVVWLKIYYYSKRDF